MLGYLREIWKCRHFWLSLVRMDLRSRYRRTFLGLGWSMLQPIAMTATLSLVFGLMFHMPWQVMAPRVLLGVALWQFLTGSVLQGCMAFFQNEAYIRQVPQPLAIYPLRVVLGAAFHYLIALNVALGLIALLPLLPPPSNWSGPVPSLHLGSVVLAVVPSLLLLSVFVWSLAVIGAFMNSYFHDTKHLAEVFFQIAFYLTPIIYSEDMVCQRGLDWLLHVNPAACFLRLIREPLLTGALPPWWLYGQGVGLTVIAVFGASLMLRRLQQRLVFQL